MRVLTDAEINAMGNLAQLALDSITRPVGTTGEMSILRARYASVFTPDTLLSLLAEVRAGRDMLHELAEFTIIPKIPCRLS